MVLHFNVTGEKRKNVVKAVEMELGVKAKYLGVPSCAYQVDIYTIGKDGSISWDEMLDADPIQQMTSYNVIDACVKASGNNPSEWVETPEEAELTISVPKRDFTEEAIENLHKILESKRRLFSKAFKKKELEIVVENSKLEFPWFSEMDCSKVDTYTKFIIALCDMAKNQKRITAKPKENENENEKYAFRCFLLRLGFIGDEYKEDRKILLANLDGSSAFKTKKGEQEL